MYIQIPTILTFNKCNEQAVSIINAVHTTLGFPLVSIGDTNPYYMDLMDLVAGGAPFFRDKYPGMAECGPIKNTGYISLQQINLILAMGGEVTDLSVWFELDNITQEVPEGFPDRTFDFEGETLVHTWETWGIYGESHKPVKYGTKWYRSVNVGQSGEPLKVSQWINFYRTGGKVIFLQDYQKIQQENTNGNP